MVTATIPCGSLCSPMLAQSNRTTVLSTYRPGVAQKADGGAVQESRPADWLMVKYSLFIILSV